MNITRNHFVKINVNTTKNTIPPQQGSVNNKQHDQHDQRGQRGFTIIEVALVLAIAGLIFLVVFLALPALQNSQKDTARKQDVGRVVSALESYATDHQGALPTPSGSGAWCSPNGSGGSDFCSYVNKIGTEVAGTWITTIISDGVTTEELPGKNINVFIGLLCPSNANAGNATSSDAAVAVRLSNGTQYCADM